MIVIWYPAASLDGYIATPGGDSDWVSEQDEELFQEQMKNAGCVIVGRTTYEQYKDSIYNKDSGVVSYVVTTNTENFKESKSVIPVKPNPKSILERVAADGFKTVILSGGGQTNALFAEAGKIDEISTEWQNSRQSFR